MEYRVFKFADEIETLKELAVLDYEEVGHNQNELPLDPDWEKYCALDEMGLLLCCGAYDEEKLVGYFVAIVAPTLHCKNEVVAVNDALWLHPDYRGGTGVRLMKFFESQCKDLGVSYMSMNITLKYDISPLLERMGWTHVEKTYSKCIKE